MDATLVVSIAALAVVLVALAVSVHAIRRDAPALHLSMGDAAARSRYLLIVNVVLRPIRLERMMVRPITWRRRWGRAILVPHVVLGDHFRLVESFGQDVDDRRPIVVLQPGDDVRLQVGVMAAQGRVTVRLLMAAERRRTRPQATIRTLTRKGLGPSPGAAARSPRQRTMSERSWRVLSCGKVTPRSACPLRTQEIKST